ncbi:MAG: sulfatase-like hydrolase/transferase [Anaerolineae bacterium]|nr:sulfatase-like hydrolase/transferase [Anaerolineae bacterium]
MLEHTLREWRDRHFWILSLLSLVVLFCVYRITLPSPIFINLGTEGDERYLRNFNPGEQGELYPFRWTKDSSYIKIPNLGSLPLEIVLGADAARPEGKPLPGVSLIANGTVLADFTMQNGIWAHQFPYHPPLFPLPKDLLLEIRSDTFVPPGDDYRALGILLNTVEVKPIVSPLRLFQVSLVASLMGALSIAFSYLLLRWLGVSRKKSLVCGMVALALLGFGMVRQFIVARFLIGVFGLLLVGYVLAILHPLYKESRYFQSGGIPDVFPAYLLAVVLFVLMPFALYLPNQSVFDNNLTLVIPYLVLAVVYFIFLIALLVFVGQPLRTRIVILLFYIGLYLGLSDIISPIQLGELMGGRETPQEPLFLTGVEVVLAVVVAFSAIKLPWKWVKRFGSIFALLLLISEAIVVLNGLSPKTSWPFTTSTKNISNPPEKLADGGNIYHITFDGYSGASLLDSLETMKLAEEFDGFTFFKNNRANYGYTTASLPSYMTGSFYEENDSLKEWRERHNSSGMVNNVYDAGYQVSMYTPYRGWIHQKASYVKIHEDVLRQYESLSSYCHFADLWLLRVVPNYLQQEVYREGEGVFTRLFVKDVLAGRNWNVFGSVELMRQLINDEAERPDHGQYVYAHLWIPHSPNIMNRDCVFSPDDSDYDEQALCATRLMAELISKLKQLGRYDESIIIFQADHGSPGYPCLKNTSDCIMSLEIEKKIEAVNLRSLSAETIDNRTRALLLIKPPLQSRKSLVISDRPTQLADIPATLYDLLDLPVRVREGASVFSPDFPETREIHIFVGLSYQKGEKGKEYRFGQNLFEGEANHFSFTSGIGWKIYPNIHVRWE